MKLQKLASILLAAIMVFALVVPALAATNGTIAITASSDGTSPVGRTFKAYKILDVSLAADNTPAYTVPSSMLAFYSSYFYSGVTTHYSSMSQAAIDADVVAKIGALSTTSGIEAFAEAALTWLKTSAITPTTIGPYTTIGEYTVTVPLGYYIIGETAGNGSQVSAVMLDTTNAAVSIALKANTPGIEKKIVSGASLVDSANGNIGDTQHYQITSKVPDTTGFDTYTFAVTDTLATGLTFNNDIAITLNGTTLTAGTDYTVDTTAGNGYTFKINFNNFTRYKANDATYASLIGKPIVITYSAKINESAVIGNAGNKNGAQLTFSNNPQNTTTSTTVKDETVTYVTGVDITKIVAGTSSSPVTLAGATFTLKGVDPTVTNTVVTFVQSDSGTYYKQADGSYSITAGTDTTKYARTVQQTPSSSYTATATTSANGVLTFNGLKAGTYTLTETDAPDGYMLAEPVTIVVTWNDPATSPTAIWTYKLNGSDVSTVDSNGELKINVEDTKGHELPSTGGIGTTIFYIGGLVLIAGAALLLILRRKGKKAVTK
jgi:fimbrial isopeptide formation D2 family protein/LPXTG-motif cell wall-anchored protein